MAIQSAVSRLSALSNAKDERELRLLLGAVVDSIQNIATKLDTLTAKLNADGGVTDVNYATDFASTTAAIVTD